MWQPMSDLIRRTFRLWFGQQQYCVKSGAKASNGADVAAKVRHDDAIKNDLAASVCAENPHSFHRDLPDAVHKSIERNVLEINEGSIRAAYRGNAASNARNRFNDGGLSASSDMMAFLGYGKTAKDAGFMSLSRVAPPSTLLSKSVASLNKAARCGPSAENSGT